jgi:hypothetical protein
VPPTAQGVPGEAGPFSDLAQLSRASCPSSHERKNESSGYINSLFPHLAFFPLSIATNSHIAYLFVDVFTAHLPLLGSRISF